MRVYKAINALHLKEILCVHVQYVPCAALFFLSARQRFPHNYTGFLNGTAVKSKTVINLEKSKPDFQT